MQSRNSTTDTSIDKWTWEWWQWRGIPHSPKLQHYWKLTLRLLSVISRIHVAGGGLTPLQRWSWCILQPQPTQLGKNFASQIRNKVCSVSMIEHIYECSYNVDILLTLLGDSQFLVYGIIGTRVIPTISQILSTIYKYRKLYIYIYIYIYEDH